MTILDVVIQGTDDASGAFKSVDSSLGKLGATAGKAATVGLGLAAAGVTAVAAAAVGAGVAALNLSTDINNATNNIATKMGMSQDAAAGFEDVMKSIYANNFGENFNDISDAIVTVSQSLGDMPDAALQGITEDAFAMRDAFGLDVSESVMAAKNLMTEFGLDGEQAMDFIAKGMQSGLNASGDFVDSISEYGNLFGDAGFSADQMYNIMASGAETGVLGVDKIADAVKEMGVKLGEGGTDTRAAFDDIGLSFEDISSAVSDGSATWGDYFDDIVGGIEGIEDPIERQKAQVGIFGTMAEDLGVSFTEGLSTAGVALDDMAGSTEKLNAQYDNWPSMWEGAKKSALLALEPLGDELLKVGEDILPVALEAFEKLTKWIEDTLPPAIEDAKKIIEDLRKGWEENFGGIRDFITGVWDVITKEFDAFTKLFQGDFDGFALGMLDAWETLWTTVVNFLGELWTLAKPHLIALWASFTKWFNDQDWEQIGKDIVTAISDALSTFDKAAGAKITEWKATFWTWVDSVDWAALAHSIVTAVVAGLSWFGSQVGAKLAEWWQAFSDWATDPATWEAIGLIVAELILDGLDVIAKIDEVLEGWWKAFVDWFSEQPWDQHGETVTTGIKEGLANLWTNIKESFETLLKEVQSWFTEPGKFESLGHNIMDGLKKGIESKLQEVRDTIQGLADWLNGIWTKAQEAHSPSQVWWRFGRDLMSGLALGIIDNSDMPATSIEELFKDLDLMAAAKIVEKLGDAIRSVAGAVAPAIAAFNRIMGEAFATEYDFVRQFDKFERLINYLVRNFARLGLSINKHNLGVARDMVDTIEAVAGSIGETIAALKIIKNVDVPVGLGDKFVALTNEIAFLVLLFSEAAKLLEEEATPVIISYVEAATSVFGLVELALNAIKFLSDFDIAALTPQPFHLRDQIQNLRWIVNKTVQEFTDAALEMGTYAMTNIQEYIDAATGIFGLVELALNAIKFLSDFDIAALTPQPYHLRDQIQNLRWIVNTTLQEFANAAIEMDTEAVAAVQGYIDAARAVFGLVEEAIAAIAVIAEYSAVAGLLPKVQAFKDDFLAVADALLGALQDLQTDIQGLESPAEELATAISAVLNVIKPAVDALAAISEYVALDKAYIRISEFVDDFKLLVAYMGQALQQIIDDPFGILIETTYEFAEKVSTVLGVVSPAIEALAGIAEYVRLDFAYKSLGEFVDDFTLLVAYLGKALQDIIDDPFGALIETVHEFAGKVATVLGVVGPAIEALGNIGAFVSIENLGAKLAEFTGQLADAIGGELGLVTRLNEIAGMVSADDVNTASNFAESINAIFTHVMSIFGTLSDMANTDMPGGLKAILTDMVDVLRSAIPDAALAGYDFGMAWINGVREALATLSMDLSGGGGAGLVGAAAGVGGSSNLTTNLNVGPLTFNTTITNEMDEQEFHFRVIESIRSLV